MKTDEFHCPGKFQQSTNFIGGYFGLTWLPNNHDQFELGVKNSRISIN